MKNKCVFLILSTTFIIMSLFIQQIEADKLSEDYKPGIYIYTSIVSSHWRNNNQYNNQQNLIGIEYRQSKLDFYGIGWFKNSFNQPCWYIYSGKFYNFYNYKSIESYIKIAIGIIHGYHDEGGKYKGVLNKLETFPVVIPAINIKFKSMEFDIIQYYAGFVITTGVNF